MSAGLSLPGNVGGIENVVDRMVMFARGDRINIDDLPPDLRLAPEVFRIMDEDAISETMAEVEKIYIRRALARSNNVVEAAAEMLGISQASLEEMIQRYNIILDVA
jgi:DNA-binding NtrC family response regulator